MTDPLASALHDIVCTGAGWDHDPATDEPVAAGVYAALRIIPDDLDLAMAWSEARAAMPAGWQVESVQRDGRSEAPSWSARCVQLHRDREAETRDGPAGPTPAVALRALAAQLRDGRP